MKREFFCCFFSMVIFLVFSFPVGAAGEKCEAPDPNPVASIMVGNYSIDWLPKISAEGIALTIAGPGDFFWTQTFPRGTRPRFAIADIKGQCLDGQYKYELMALPQAGRRIRSESELAGKWVSSPVATQSGSFRVQGGAFLSMTLNENLGRTMDVLHYDDVIITGSLCVGFDCIDGESFGYCTQKYKENNLQVCFEDTSIGTFPTNDWKIQINDTTSGGASYFTIWDVDGGKRPFTIEAGAPAHSLYIEDYGRVGLGTSIPYVELHIVDGDSPTVRLDQDGSSGWTAQSWDLCGNETNFFLRDVTNGSKLCFRVQPNTPSNTLCLKSDGRVGIGTWSPEYKMEIETTGENAILCLDRTDGAKFKLSTLTSKGQIGTISNHDLVFTSNNANRVTIAAGGNVGIGTTSPSYPLHMGSGAYCSVGGTWTNGSSIAFKDNVQGLNAGAAMQALAQLRPVTFVYKVDHSEKHVGFIAEEVPELVAMNDRQGLSPMDIVAVLTKVVQEQQKTIEELGKRLEKLEQK